MEYLHKKAEKILARYKNKWLALENVTSAGIGRTSKGSPCIIISLAQEDNAIREMMPPEIDGIPLEVKVSGEIDAF